MNQCHIPEDLNSPSMKMLKVRYKKYMRRVQKVKIHHVQADREISYAYYGNTAIDLDPLPVSRARLTVEEPALFD